MMVAMTQPPAIPPVPADPKTRTLVYDDPTEINSYKAGWMTRDSAQTAEIARLNALIKAQPVPDPVPVPATSFVRWANWWCADGMRSGARVLHHLDETGSNAPEVAVFAELAKRTTGPRFSWDTSSLGNDASKSESLKISSHKTLFGVDNIQHVRVFFGTSVPNWSDARILALTDKDSMVVSSLSTDRAGVAAFLAATPAKFRTRPGQVTYAFGHEREANLDVGPLLKAWLDGNQMVADLLHAAPGYSTDDLVKIGLWYSQEQDKRAGVSIPNREQLYGGQNFGSFGEDVYNPRAATRYFTPAEMFGPITAFCKQVGRPCAIPEWGGERLTTDTTGTGRAKFIADGAAFLTTAAA